MTPSVLEDASIQSRPQASSESVFTLRAWRTSRACDTFPERASLAPISPSLVPCHKLSGEAAVAALECDVAWRDPQFGTENANEKEKSPFAAVQELAARVITAIVVAEYARTSTLEEKTRSSEPNVASGKTRGEKRAAPPYAQTYGQTVFASCDAFLSARWSYQRPFRALVEHRHFEAVTTSLVVANTAAMAFEHHGMSPASAAFLESLNFVFVVAFAAELLVKLAGLGLKEYFADTFNRFDFVIVLVGVAELLFALGGGAGAGALRAFRLVRVLRLGRLLSSLRPLGSMNRRKCPRGRYGAPASTPEPGAVEPTSEGGPKEDRVSLHHSMPR